MLYAGYLFDQNPNCSSFIDIPRRRTDEIRRILINELNKTFITPFDREDIFASLVPFDDVLDYAFNSTLLEIELLKVQAHFLHADDGRSSSRCSNEL